MKFHIALLLTLSLIASSSANATLLDLEEVGGLDTLLISTTLANSDDAIELIWVESLLIQSATLDDKYNSDGTDWLEVDGQTNIFYLSLEESPNYFLLKFGDGGIDMDSHFLFQNIGKLSFAVIDLSDLGIDLSENKNFTIDRISHVGELSTTKMAIPEPMLIGIFALVLLIFSRQITPFR